MNQVRQNAAGTSDPRRTTLGIEWFGQTAASLLWIASVFVSGVGGTGDVLQLLAASAWLVANLAVAIRGRNH